MMQISKVHGLFKGGKCTGRIKAKLSQQRGLEVPEIKDVTLNRVVTVGLTEKVTSEQSPQEERKLAVLIAEGSAF